MPLSVGHLCNGNSILPTDPHRIRISSEFTSTPFGRYKGDGPESGEVFREKLLIPAFEKYGRVELILDGLDGLPSSFWEEVMGGIIRSGMSFADLKAKLSIVTSESEMQTFVRLGWRYAEDAANRESAN